MITLLSSLFQYNNKEILLNRYICKSLNYPIVYPYTILDRK